MPVLGKLWLLQRTNVKLWMITLSKVLAALKFRRLMTFGATKFIMITGCIALRVLEQSRVKYHQQNVTAWLSDRPDDGHSSAQLSKDMYYFLPEFRGTWATWGLNNRGLPTRRFSSFCSKPSWASAVLLLPKHFVELTQCTTLIWALLPDCRTCHMFCIIDFGKQYFPRWLS